MEMKNCAKCANCGKACYRDDLVSVYVGRGWEDWCQDCCDDSTFVCEHCGYMIFNEACNYIDGCKICIDCTMCSDCYRICERCGEIHHEDNMEYSDRLGGYVCDDCRTGTSDSQSPQQEDNFHARVQALRSRNEKQNGDCMEILTMLVILAVLFMATF
jgi:hypothetical protein